MGITGLWDILGEGEVWHIADYAADFFRKHNRPMRIAVDEAGWRFKNLNAHQVETIREGEAAANPIEKVILQRIYRLLRLNIQLIFVDDGLRRPRKRDKAGGGRVEYDVKKGTRQLLAQLKVPHHEAPGEAEAECARMQVLGIVDAVWSDDGDSFMFGCGTLMKQHKQGNTNVKDHVRIYRSDDILRRHDMDRESLVLFAVLAGGDYVTKGLPGCGPKTAAVVSRRSFGLAHKLCHVAKKDLAKWRQDLEDALRRFGKADVPWDFPDFKAVGNYRQPIISTDEQLRNLRGLRRGWDQRFDQPSLRVYLRHKFNFRTREYLKHIAPILVARRLARALTPEGRMENLELGLQRKRTRKVKAKEGEEEPPAKAEVKIWFSPLSVVEVDLSTRPEEEDWSNTVAEDGISYDPLQPVECELLDCLLKHGLPEGGLPEAPPPARRKRKPDTQDDDEGSPNKRKRESAREEQHNSPQDSAKQKCGTSRKNKSANPAATKSRSKKGKKRTDDQVSLARSPTPPPATFQLPEGLAELRAKARVVDLRDDDEDSEGDATEYDEESDLERAIQLSMTEGSASNIPIPSSSLPLADLRAKGRAIDLYGDDEDRGPETYDADADSDLARAIQLSLTASSVSSSSVMGPRPTSGYVYGGPAATLDSASKTTTPMGSMDKRPPKSATTGAKSASPCQASQPSHENASHARASDARARQAKPQAVSVLVPGESISAQALRDLRAGSSLLAGAGSSGTLCARRGSETPGPTSIRKMPEVIDLT